MQSSSTVCSPVFDSGGIGVSAICYRGRFLDSECRLVCIELADLWSAMSKFCNVQNFSIVWCGPCRVNACAGTSVAVVVVVVVGYIALVDNMVPGRSGLVCICGRYTRHLHTNRKVSTLTTLTLVGVGR